MPLYLDPTPALALKLDKAGGTVTGALTVAGQLSATAGVDITVNATGAKASISNSHATGDGLAVLLGATTRYGYKSKLIADAAYRLQVTAAGRLEWGDGAAAVDTSLYRSGVASLATNSRLIVSRPTGVDIVLSTVGDPGDGHYRLNVEASGKITWGSGAAAPDTNLYRGGAGQLTSTSQLLLVGNVNGPSLYIANSHAGSAGINVTLGSATTILQATITGDTHQRFSLGAAGNLLWGPGNAVSDTTLYRAGVDQLRTDDNLMIGGHTGGVHRGLTVGDGVGVGQAQVLFNSPAGSTGALVYQQAGVNRWWQYFIGGDPSLYVRDMVNSKMHATYTPGAGTGGGNTEVNSALTVLGAASAASVTAGGPAFPASGAKVTRTSGGTVGTIHQYIPATNSPSLLTLWGGTWSGENTGTLDSTYAFYHRAVPAGQAMAFGKINLGAAGAFVAGDMVDRLTIANAGVAVAGTFTASGATTLSSTLSVASTATFSGWATVAADFGIGTNVRNTVPYGMFGILNTGPANVPQIIRGAAAQAVPLFRLQDNAGTNLLDLDQLGRLVFKTDTASYIYFGATSDVNLYRSAANILKTDDTLQAAGDLYTGGVFYIGSLGGDTYLYRSSTNHVKTDGALSSATNIYAAHGSGTQSGFGYMGPAGQAGIMLQDVRLYRHAAGMLRTDDSLTVGGGLEVGGRGWFYAAASTSSASTGTNWVRSPKHTVTLFVGDSGSTAGYTADESAGDIRFNGSGVGWGDVGYYPQGGTAGQFRFSVTGAAIATAPNARVGVGSLYVAGDAGITIGPDITLTRLSASLLGLNSETRIERPPGGVALWSRYAGDAAGARWLMYANGEMYWAATGGAAWDTTLYRDGAGVLKTNGVLAVATPTATGHAATKGYVDTRASGRDWRATFTLAADAASVVLHGFGTTFRRMLVTYRARGTGAATAHFLMMEPALPPGTEGVLLDTTFHSEVRQSVAGATSSAAYSATVATVGIIPAANATAAVFGSGTITIYKGGTPGTNTGTMGGQGHAGFVDWGAPTVNAHDMTSSFTAVGTTGYTALRLRPFAGSLAAGSTFTVEAQEY